MDNIAGNLMTNADPIPDGILAGHRRTDDQVAMEQGWCGVVKRDDIRCALVSEMFQIDFRHASFVNEQNIEVVCVRL